MDIFKALREDKAPDTYLQNLMKKGLKREVPYIVNIHIPANIQNEFNIEFGPQGLSLDRPWKSVPKKLFLQHIKRFKDKSPFHPFADNLKVLRDPEVIVGLDTSNLKNLTNYYICVTQEGRIAVLEELKSLHKRILDHIGQSFSREPNVWMSLGSEKELDEDRAVDNRPLINFDWVGQKIDRMDRDKPLNFVNVDADSSLHFYTSITDTMKSKYKLVKAVAIDYGTQVAPTVKNGEAQTVPEIPMNASTQFNPEIDALEKEQRIQNEAPRDETELANQMKAQYEKIISALTYNGEYDLYKDDYAHLGKEGGKSWSKSKETYVHYMTFVNTMCDPNKFITCTAWYPNMCGTVATAYGENVIFHFEEIKSDSDDSDYEVKPSPLEEYVPNIDPLLQANEVLEAGIWKEGTLEILENYDKKEDKAEYKLGLLTLCFLVQSQNMRELELLMEKKYEESRPELDEMDFTPEYAYKMYDESTYDPDADLYYKFRLDDCSMIPPDSEAPDEATIVKFHEKLKPYLSKDDTPLSQENKTFNIVWDANHWNLGFTLKDEALIVHRRHFGEELTLDGGPLLEIPKPKTYCPFLRVKKTDRGKGKAKKTKPRKQSHVSRSSVSSFTKGRRLSSVSRSSDNQSVSSHHSSVTKKSVEAFKKKSPHYVEVTDDEEMERYDREHCIVQTGPTHFVHIWSISNDLEPLLKCVGPYEVSAMSFCPHNGNLLAAGTISGQIILWDLQGYLLQRDQVDHEPTHFERFVRKELKRQMSWYRELKVPGQLKETAVSTMAGAHNSKVISIQWIHPQLTFEGGHYVNGEAEEDGTPKSYSYQFLSTSMDGDTKCWDLKAEPLPKVDYMFTERTIARRTKNPKPEPLTIGISKYSDFHNRWMPIYTLREPVTESARGVKAQTSLLASSIRFQNILYPYKRKREADARIQEKMTDIVEYQYNPLHPSKVHLSQTAFLGTMFGIVAQLSWSGQAPNPKLGEPADSEILDIKVMEAVHDGPIIEVLPHPFVKDIALSVGGHVYAIWNLNMSWPIKWKRYYGKQITCCSWSPLKPSLFRIGLTDGTVEIWDIILQSHAPRVVIPAAGAGISGFTSHTLPLPRGLMGCCDMNASVLFYFIPWIFQSWKKHELDSLTKMLDKEPERKNDLKQWADNWRESHVRLKKKQSSPIEGSNVKVDLHDDVEDSGKKLMVDVEDSIFRQGRFALRRDVPPRECKAYYRELYKWYLRRKGRTTRLMEEKERKWYEEEERTIIKDLLKNKRIDLAQLQKAMVPLVQKENRLKAKEGRVIAMLAQADKIFKTAVAKIFNVVNYQISYASKDSLIEDKEEIKLVDSFKEVDDYFGEEFEKAEIDLWSQLEKVNFTDRSFDELLRERMEKRELFNDRRRFWNPDEKWMRIMAKSILEENGFICGQWEPRELSYEYRKYANRLKNIDEYKKLFGDDYDPLWDVDKKATNLKEFPYRWPYVTEEEIYERRSSADYKSEHKFPLVNLNSALDLDFIANTSEDVIALMLQEQRDDSGKFGRTGLTIDSGALDETDLLVGSVDMSDSQLSFRKDDEIDGEEPSGDNLMYEEMDDIVDEPAVETSGPTNPGLDGPSTLSTAPSETSGDIGLSSQSKIVVNDTPPQRDNDIVEEEEILGESYPGEDILPEELGEGRSVSFKEGDEFVSLPESQFSVQSRKSEVVPERDDESEVLYPGDPTYPDNWRDICEDECVSEGESIPSPRSSPSNVTDFSDISDVVLFEPEGLEEEPYREYYEDKGGETTGGLAATVKKELIAEDEPTEEYMGESSDDGEQDDNGERRVRPTKEEFLKGKRVVPSSSSDSSDEEGKEEKDFERTVTQIIAERRAAIAEREQKLRELV